MKIKDYGEKVTLELCNLLYQKESETDYETLHEAWKAAESHIDKKLIKIYIRTDRQPKKKHLLRILPKEKGYLLQPDWDKPVSVENISDIYDVLSQFVIERDD